jgi:rifampicin phosphotransferase
MVFNELARRGVAAGNISTARHLFMLTEEELDAYLEDGASFRTKLAERYADFQLLSNYSPPYIVDGAALPLSQWERTGQVAVINLAVGDVLKGIAGSPGVVTGTAKVLLSVDDPTELDPGDILIAPSTDPSWTPLFLAAAAVVVNVGAVGTHAVIVSRELGIPCVPSIVDATRRIPTGANITVDGNTGTVTINSLP